MVVNAAVPGGEETGLPDDRTDPSTRLEGWRRFVEADPVVFDLLPDQQWQALTPQLRKTYDEARIAYHSELRVVRTFTVKEIAHQGRLLTLLNQREHGACRGMIVSGQWTTGKTRRSNSSAAPTNCVSSSGIPAVTASQSSTSPPRPKAPRVNSPWSSPGSWACP
ncbi:hypothetical protein [Streptomyces caniscabiei]|uniref:hypothetical protein n=1 Tax=Streptomyces caniscabiei TaxID=2746961 RepID=UPI000AC72AAA